MSYELRVTNYELRITVSELSIVNCQLSIVNYQLSIVNRQFPESIAIHHVHQRDGDKQADSEQDAT